MIKKFLLVVSFFLLFGFADKAHAWVYINLDVAEGVCYGTDGYVGFVDGSTGNWISDQTFYPGEELYISLHLENLGDCPAKVYYNYYPNTNGWYASSNIARYSSFNLSRHLLRGRAGNTDSYASGTDRRVPFIVKNVSNGNSYWKFLHYDLLPELAINFSASPTSIYLGESTDLTWAVDGATSCDATVLSAGAGSWAGSKSSSGGTESVTPTSTGTKRYVLACSSPGGNISETVDVVVNSLPAPIIQNLSAITPIDLGDPTTITWRVSGDATTCTASGNWSGLKSHANWVFYNQTVTPTTAGLKTYTLTCSNAGGIVSRSTGVQVNTTDGTCGTRNTTYGTETAWPGSSTYCASGTASASPVFPTDGNSVSWICNGSGGGTNQNCAATNVAAPVIENLSATTPVELGQPTTISWRVSGGATTCTANSTDGDWLGPKSHVNGQNYNEPASPTLPLELKTYTLSCTNLGGPTIMSTDVQVDSPVVPSTAPRANITVPGGDMEVNVGVAIGFTGNGTDLDAGETIINYQWRRGVLGSCTGTELTTTTNPLYSLAFGAATEFDICLIVQDSNNTWSGNYESRHIKINALPTYNCQLSIPTNAESWGATEEVGLTDNSTNWDYSASDTPALCEYKCTSPSVYNVVTFVCDPPTCIGNIPNNSDLCSSDSTGLTADVGRTLVGSCGAPKCEYICKTGFTYNGGSGECDSISSPNPSSWKEVAP